MSSAAAFAVVLGTGRTAAILLGTTTATAPRVACCHDRAVAAKRGSCSGGAQTAHGRVPSAPAVSMVQLRWHLGDWVLAWEGSFDS